MQDYFLLFNFVLSTCLGVGFSNRWVWWVGDIDLVFILEETVKTVYSWRADLDFMGFGRESIGRNVLVLFSFFLSSISGNAPIQYRLLRRPIVTRDKVGDENGENGISVNVVANENCG